MMQDPTSLPGGHDYLQTALAIAAFVLPVLGILVVVVSLIALAFPFGNRFREKTQKFKGFGIDLEMSVLPLALLLGVVLCFAGIYIASESYESRLAELAEYPSRLENLVSLEGVEPPP